MQIAGFAGSVGQLYSSARGGAVGPAAPVAEPPREPYLSPVFRFDKQARVVVFQFRDAETGDVKQQWPSEKVVKLYRSGSQPAADTSSPPELSGSSEEPAPEAPAVGTGSSEAAPKPAPGGNGGERIRLTA